MARIGVGITTYQRFDMFKECFENLLKHSKSVEEIMIVEDCSTVDKEKYDEYFSNPFPNNILIVRNPVNLGVGASKNIILKYFYDKGYDYIFTLEDDINVIHDSAFDKYVEAVEKTGFQYFNFSQHGLGNISGVDYITINGVDLSLNPNVIGAVSVHTRKLIDEIGYYDEQYTNAMEHVDYCYLASLKGLTTPFWQFADLKDCEKYFREQPGSIQKSSIRIRDDWGKNIEKGYVLFKEKHGVELREVPRP